MEIKTRMLDGGGSSDDDDNDDDDEFICAEVIARI